VKVLVIHVAAAYVESAADGEFGELARYEEAPGDARWMEEVDEQGKRRRVWRRESNHNIVTRTLFVTFAPMGEDGRFDFDALFTLRVWGKAVNTFGASFVRDLNRRSLMVRGADGKLHPPAIFSVTALLKTELTGNDRGDWYIPHFAVAVRPGQPGAPIDEDIEVAHEIYDERVAFTALSYDPTPKGPEPPAPPPEQIGPSNGNGGEGGASAQLFAPTPPLGTPGAKFTTGIAAAGGGCQAPFAPMPDAAPDGPELN
jgi:hypothetical protein